MSNRTRRYGMAFVWVLFALATGVLYQNQHTQNDKVAAAVHDLCTVVTNVHDNAKFQFRSADDQLNQTLRYLADAAPRKDSPDLYRRVQANLPTTRSRVAQTRDLLAATDPPESCNHDSKDKP